MKTLKGINLFGIMLALVGMLFLFDSCTTCEGDCPPNSTCVDGVCECDEGFSGVNCEIQDLCSNVICPTNAECEDGDCYCLAGYEGAECDTEIRAKMLGVYTASDICNSGTYQYTVTILNSTNSVADFLIEGFGGFGDPVIAVRCTVLDEDDFEIVTSPYPGINSLSSIPDVNNRQGIYDPATGVITVNYEAVFDNNESDECDLILTPQ